MRVVMFCHSLRSDWNHGNAHFLRGVVTELLCRGHHVDVWEPADGWSARNLEEQEGSEALHGYKEAYPGLCSKLYQGAAPPMDQALRKADLVLVHEWNTRELVAAVGTHHRSHREYLLLFHDTHHRAVTKPAEMQGYDLDGYDAVLAFGESLRERYAQTHPQLKSLTWHEAADTRVFRPVQADVAGELIWIGNWGDNERTRELTEYLLQPVAELGLEGRVHGVRYPQEALMQLQAAGLDYAGWIANHRVPHTFASHSMTVHIPRGPYAEALPGIPTIRVFEALACGIPLVSAPWRDTEGLFTAGKDYLTARDTHEMRRQLARLRDDADLRESLREHGMSTIRSRHTCAHRVTELLEFAARC